MEKIDWHFKKTMNILDQLLFSGFCISYILLWHWNPFWNLNRKLFARDIKIVVFVKSKTKLFFVNSHARGK